jgi:hypothetical protein
MDEGQVKCGPLKGLVQRVVVAKYDQGTSLRTTTATPPGLKQYLFFISTKKSRAKKRTMNTRFLIQCTQIQ